jgi:hypothetical protein
MSESEFSRRSMLQRLATAAGTVTVLTVGAHQVAAQTKVSKTVVAYQDHPNGKLSCDNCINFQPPSGCKVVDGDITAQGWCKAYAPKG